MNNVQIIRQSDYLNFPKFLLEREFETISLMAKLLYTFMLNRTLKNGIKDEKGRFYIYYKIEEMAQDLQRTKSTIIRKINELETFGLIEVNRHKAAGKMNQIYVKIAVLENNYEQRKNHNQLYN